MMHQSAYGEDLASPYRGVRTRRCLDEALPPLLSPLAVLPPSSVSFSSRTSRHVPIDSFTEQIEPD